MGIDATAPIPRLSKNKESISEALRIRKEAFLWLQHVTMIITAGCKTYTAGNAFRFFGNSPSKEHLTHKSLLCTTRALFRTFVGKSFIKLYHILVSLTILIFQACESAYKYVSSFISLYFVYIIQYQPIKLFFLHKFNNFSISPFTFFVFFATLTSVKVSNDVR